MEGKFMTITIGIAIVNVLLFLILSFGGMTEDAMYMMEHGAMYLPYLLENGEWYRLFSSMFLHFGIAHLINNMVTLLVMGKNVERFLGKFRFTVIYLLSGLGGNLLSLSGEMLSGNYHVSAGASGAIFGLTGALLAMSLSKRYRYVINRQSILFIIALNLYLGFTSQGIDNLAHIGGLITGFLVTTLLAGIPRKSYPRFR